MRASRGPFQAPLLYTGPSCLSCQLASPGPSQGGGQAEGWESLALTRGPGPRFVQPRWTGFSVVFGPQSTRVGVGGSGRWGDIRPPVRIVLVIPGKCWWRRKAASVCPGSKAGSVESQTWLGTEEQRGPGQGPRWGSCLSHGALFPPSHQTACSSLGRPEAHSRQTICPRKTAAEGKASGPRERRAATADVHFQQARGPAGVRRPEGRGGRTCPHSSWSLRAARPGARAEALSVNSTVDTA